MRNIAVLTGTRAEYGLLRPVIQAVQDHDQLNLQLIVTGMHLSPQYGMTVRDIEADGYPIDARVEMTLSADSTAAMGRAVGLGIIQLIPVFEQLQSDFVVVLGDRTEGFAGAVAAAHVGVGVAHMHGGDVTHAGFDDSYRHAITKFAHVHFPATPRSAERIQRLGEPDWRIHMVGAPCLDTILATDFLTKDALAQEFAIDADKPWFLLVQHPVSSQSEASAEQMQQTVDAVAEFDAEVILIAPNSDAGNHGIRRVIDGIREQPRIHVVESMPHRSYLSFMKACDVMVGNSSSGIIEAVSLGLPVVNIGQRQGDRERAENVIDVPHDREAVVNAIKRALTAEFQAIVDAAVSPYGDGKTGSRVADVLASIETGACLLEKKLTY